MFKQIINRRRRFACVSECVSVIDSLQYASRSAVSIFTFREVKKRARRKPFNTFRTGTENGRRNATLVTSWLSGFFLFEAHTHTHIPASVGLVLRCYHRIEISHPVISEVGRHRPKGARARKTGQYPQSPKIIPTSRGVPAYQRAPERYTESPIRTSELRA